jgi:hypothetical protein
VWHGALMVDICRQTLFRKPGRKKPLRRPGQGWEENIRMDLWETGWKGVH